mmetsp:Transcript_58936/g.132751  ORF Transcript_58936/g.132751 Transcript_58936/m.132751 type:complete len:521 (+) Transcript_58936:1-1563(+)
MNMESFARLLGHVTGFSAIAAWGCLQQLLVHGFGGGRPPLEGALALLAVLVASFGMHALLQITDWLRDYVVSHDQNIDAFEVIWDEKTKETENDVMALTISFLLIQAFRLIIGGVLPNEEGGEPGDVTHNRLQISILLGLGCVFAVLAAWVKRRIHGRRRLHEIAKKVWAMCFAWCTFFGLSWWLTSEVLVEEHDAIVAVVLALISTAIAFSLIRGLDILADLDATDESVDMSIFAVIEALGILVGFSWEQAFDTAVGSIAEKVTFMPPCVTKLILALLLCALVGPAWRLYILPTELQLEEDLGKRSALQVPTREHSVHSQGSDEDISERKKLRKVMKEKAKRARQRLVTYSKIADLKKLQAERHAEVKQLDVRIQTKLSELASIARTKTFRRLRAQGTSESLTESLIRASSDGSEGHRGEGSPAKGSAQEAVIESKGSEDSMLSPKSKMEIQLLKANSQLSTLDLQMGQMKEEHEKLTFELEVEAVRVAELEKKIMMLEQASQRYEELAPTVEDGAEAS